MNLFTNKGAKFSTCRKFRYALWRIWDTSKPFIMFIGLNPSNANEDTDDPTIRRVKKFTSDWGYGGFYMMNLYSFVTPYPPALKQSAGITTNDLMLKEYSRKAEKVVFCYGAFKEAKQRAMEIIKMFPDAYCLGKNADGSPKHPLYLKSEIKLVKF